MTSAEQWRPIGVLARETGVKVPTIRFYEEIGLMPEAKRTDGAWRLYDESARQRLDFIKHSRDLGFSVDDIRALLRMSSNPENPCADAEAIASAQLQTVERKIAQLEALRTELQKITAACDGGRIAECRVIEALVERRFCGDAHAET